MADNKEKSNELKTHGNSEGNVSGRPQGNNTGPVAGGADNTRGENKPSREGTSGGAKKGKASAGPDSPSDKPITFQKDNKK